MDFLKDKNKKRQLIQSYIVFIGNGMLALSIGSLLPFIRDAKGLDYAFAGMIVSLHSVGNLVASFAAGALPSLVGRKKSILFFNAFFAIGNLLILLANNNFLIAAAFFMSGLARGATSNFCNKMINEIAPGQAAIMNGLHAMFAVGAFGFPLILTAITKAGDANWVYASVFMVIMGVLSWLLYYTLPLENDAVKKQEKGEGTNWGFFKEPLFYLCILALFFYLCAEQGVIGWMVTYFKDTGILPASFSQISASLLWIMILVGRLLTAWGSTKVKKEKLLVAMGFGLIGFLFLMLFTSNTTLIIIGICGFGFSMAGIYPTTVSFTGSLIEKYPIAWSFILTTASAGSIIMPTVIGRIAETAGIGVGMKSIAVVVAIELLFILVLYAYVTRQRKMNH